MFEGRNVAFAVQYRNMYNSLYTKNRCSNRTHCRMKGVSESQPFAVAFVLLLLSSATHVFAHFQNVYCQADFGELITREAATVIFISANFFFWNSWLCVKKETIRLWCSWLFYIIVTLGSHSYLFSLCAKYKTEKYEIFFQKLYFYLLFSVAKAVLRRQEGNASSPPWVPLKTSLKTQFKVSLRFSLSLFVKTAFCQNNGTNCVSFLKSRKEWWCSAQVMRV